ncbi:U4/U6.U5 tri-snRNP-associated protein 2 [Tetrabaena socialis]|uniref:U4/U6.U5 tri-snRNP-associated protein 2 n=1 Tax=Tetrabaena socialis TaxID=47790 RepID=A0A2J8AFZ5_9CHLO|nr:U4/U6.U5 tri-snRNP-associated protein 2 [Tetrabaena socialis]|eukprot:PNH11443.1 U4/U6.U5 tri-snRNP-associated protein 2 [Tetrabaena socialis]
MKREREDEGGEPAEAVEEAEDGPSPAKRQRGDTPQGTEAAQDAGAGASADRAADADVGAGAAPADAVAEASAPAPVPAAEAEAAAEAVPAADAEAEAEQAPPPGDGRDERADEGGGGGEAAVEDDDELFLPRSSSRAAVKKGSECPYLDTISRQNLDFDFEKCCSVSLSPVNVYVCLVCGKYFQGRGLCTHAYTHSLESAHHMFMKLDNGKGSRAPAEQDDHAVKRRPLPSLGWGMREAVATRPSAEVTGVLVIGRASALYLVPAATFVGAAGVAGFSSAAAPLPLAAAGLAGAAWPLMAAAAAGLMVVGAGLYVLDAGTAAGVGAARHEPMGAAVTGVLGAAAALGSVAASASASASSSLSWLSAPMWKPVTPSLTVSTRPPVEATTGTVP